MRTAGVIDDLRAQWDAAIARYRQARADLENNESQLYAMHDQVMAAGDPADIAEWQAQEKRVIGAQVTLDKLESMATTVSNAWGYVTSAPSSQSSLGSDLYDWFHPNTTPADAPVAAPVDQPYDVGQNLVNAWSLSGARMRAAGIAGTLGLPVLIPAGMTVAGFLALVAIVGTIAASCGAYVMYQTNKLDLAGWIQTRANELVGQGMTPEKASNQAQGEARTQANAGIGYQFLALLNRTILIVGLAIVAAVALPHLMKK